MTTRNPFLWLALLGISAGSALAQSDTVPAGYFTVNIPAGTVSSPSLSLLSFPLLDNATATGQMVGLVTGITSNTITNSGAGWTAGQLSVQATPYLIEFTSGAAAGRTFLLSNTTTSPSTANTGTTVTLDPTFETTDLTTLGIVPGTDTYQILPADTISSLFGTPSTTGIIGAQGAALANQADQVMVYSNGTWVSYYYNTTTSGAPPVAAGWTKTGVFGGAGANVAIKPDTGVIYTRRGAALSLMLMGQAPSIARQTAVSSTGITLLSNSWPVDIGLGNSATEVNGSGQTVTLQPSNFQKISGWVTGAQSTADNVLVYSSGTWLTYFYNGSNPTNGSWVKTGVFGGNGEIVVIPAGSVVLLSKKTAASQPSILSEALPYSL